jgi:small subunit ribosomal protein S17e
LKGDDEMGNIKTSFVKRAGQQIYDQHKEKFTTDYSKNKELIKEFATIKSKKLRNVIVGYVTTLKKQEEAS